MSWSALVERPGAATRRASARTVTTREGLEAVRLRSAGPLEATFAPEVGMTCCSLRHGADELLGERLGLAAYASRGASMGLSLMHPWSGRLSRWHYSACGASVLLPVSPLLHTDRSGLPVNGVQACGRSWAVQATGATAGRSWIEATLLFDRDPRRLKLFPYPHRVHVRAELNGSSLRIATLIEATGSVPVPCCHAYRIHVRLAGGEATMVLPSRERLVTDERMLPSGGATRCEMGAFTIPTDRPAEMFLLRADRRITVATGTHRLMIESAGLPFGLVRSSAGEPHLLVETSAAAPDALCRGGFPVATPRRPHRAVLCLSVDELSE